MWTEEYKSKNSRDLIHAHFYLRKDSSGQHSFIQLRIFLNFFFFLAEPKTEIITFQLLSL